MSSLLAGLRASLEGTVGVATGLKHGQSMHVSRERELCAYLNLLALVMVMAVHAADVTGLLRRLRASLEGTVRVAAVL